jgi:hypothetical protein
MEQQGSHADRTSGPKNMIHQTPGLFPNIVAASKPRNSTSRNPPLAFRRMPLELVNRSVYLIGVS